ncbi:MAG: 50S ribosomal protein L20 [Patescibacteria group bacterium]|nr:50S ribosomal protein L20 [Patescibacteria group bacterium]MCX7589830.1 50S ribosomal protein L20 [Patescibacteria group bacterium]MDW8279698.1 50S ribosomal protein L20 [bacterium]
MSRVKRGKIKTKKRRKLLKLTKGFKWGRKSKKRQAKEAVLHKLSHAFRGRKQKKRDYRRLWNTKINAALKEKGLKYNQFINNLKNKKIKLDRKILADLAENHNEVFQKIIELTK